ncbi:hypothetical protein QVD17_03496 [Tagetes erecta]|uniref:Calcineurin-like phosphoesterase domain-containing protein n=1 Tax=Tagetes erecta TaxID=13708 RepID=A0AAD8P3F0_TARER|nr:hypothetical protein QVD17_03496 [Tagetes erecta]
MFCAFMLYECSPLAFQSQLLQDEDYGSNEYNQFQHGSLNTTKQLIEYLKNIDVVFHIGDISYANGYLSHWDQFTSQIKPIASSVPYMISSDNHERARDLFIRTMIQEESVVLWLKLCFTFLHRTKRRCVRYSVDYGHAKNYERTCPMYQSKSMNNESKEVQVLQSLLPLTHHGVYLEIRLWVSKTNCI